MNGLFNFQQSDLFLEGRNGLNVEMITKYNSSDGNSSVFNPVTRQMMDSKRFSSRNGIGKGWSWGFSSLDTTLSSKSSTGKIKGTIVYLGNGETFVSNVEPGESEVYKRKLSDVELIEDNGTFAAGGEYSKYLLNYKTGKKEYFSADGKLLGIQDRYGNNITFNYKTVDGAPVLSKITDSLKREINISYEDISNGRKVTVISPDNRTVVYNLIKIPQSGFDGYALDSKKDVNGAVTKFEYGYEKTSGGNQVVNLKKIIYPTGAYTENTYISDFKGGKEEGYRIVTTGDVDKGVSYNKKTYKILYPGKDIHFTTDVVEENGKTIRYLFDRDTGFNRQRSLKNTANKIMEDTVLDVTSAGLPTKVTTKYYIRPYDETTETPPTTLRYKSDSYEYDADGNVTKHTDPVGITEQYAYGKYDMLSEEKHSYSGNTPVLTIQNTIDASGNITTKTERGTSETFRTTTYTYDGYGNRLSETITPVSPASSKSIRRTYKYDDKYNTYLAQKSLVVTDYNGTEQTINEYSNYDFMRRMKTERDGKGNETVYTYDGRGRVIKILHTSDQTAVTVDYNDQSNICTVTDENGNKVQSVYDGLGKLLQNKETYNGILTTIEENHYRYDGLKDWSKDGRGNQVSFGYDYVGRLNNVTNSDRTQKTITYDDYNNIKVEVDEEGNRHQYNYDNDDRVVLETMYPDKNNIGRSYTTSYSYNLDLGKVERITDGNNNATTYQYDGLGRTKTVTIGGSEPKVESYQYDALNNVVNITTPGQKSIKRTYDESGRLVKEIDPMGKSEATVYDGAGNIIRTIDKDGQITNFTYDGRNKVRSKTVGNMTIGYTYDNAGNLTSVSDSSGKVSYQYYENGKLKGETTPDSKTIAYEYDGSGNKSKVTDYLGKIISYGYDSRNRLSSVTVDGSSTTYGYYGNGLKSYVSYPGGMREQFGYDGVGNLTSVVNTRANGTVLSSFTYTYDNAGNQKTKTDGNGTTTYTYDTLNRVKTSLEPTSDLTEYNYDLDGNIQNKKVTNNKNEKQESTYSYDAENKLNSITTNQYTNGTSLTAASTSSFNYDQRGNQISATKKTTKNGQTVIDSNTAYKYNELDQLTEFTATNGTKTAYAYYADGLRKSKTISNVTTGYYYDGNHVIIETTGGTFSSRNILGNSQIGRQTPASTYYYLYNGHGDVMNVVDSTGNVQNNYDYDIYGMGKVATENGLRNPVRYAGEYFDEESGLYYLRGRYYSPDTMRFISEDSYKGEIGSPLSLNLYAYCAGNPIEYSDPSGHMRGYKQPICDMDTSVPAPVVDTPKPKSTFQSIKESVQTAQVVSDMMLPIAISSVTSKGDNESKMATAAAVLAAEAEIKAGASVAEQKIVNVIRGTGNVVEWTSGRVSNAAKQLESGATSVTVKSRSEAEELFLGLYQGKGYKNVTGMDAMDAKNFLGTKGNTYHWDDVIGADGRVVGHSPTNADGAMPHLQIHPEKGKVIRIFFEP